MKKPTPPDQERIELIINGDDPESHRAAQETARILAAPQIARTIQKRIEDCRKRIGSIVELIAQCNTFVKAAKSVTDPHHFMIKYHSLQVHSSQIEHCVPAVHQLMYVDLVSEIRAAWLNNAALDPYCYKPDLKSIQTCANLQLRTMVESHTQIAKLLTAHLPQLQEELKKYEGQWDDLFTLVKGK